jgi:hypothetical protein
MRTAALVISFALGAASVFLADGFGFAFGFDFGVTPTSAQTCDEVREENHILWQIIDRPTLRGEVYAQGGK